MWCMIVVAQVIVNDRVVGMVRFQQVFEGSRSFFGVGFDIVDIDGRKIDLGVIPASKSKE